MNTGVIIFATVVLVVSAQDYYPHGHGTSQSAIYHDKSHKSHGQESLYYSSPVLIQSGGSSYYRPSVHVAPYTQSAGITHTAPITHSAAITHATPITHSAAITHAAPITHSAGITHTAPITHSAAITHAAPITQSAAISHAIPISHTAPIAYYSHHTPVHKARVIHVPVAHHYSPIFTQHTHVHSITPVIHHGTPKYAVPAITLAHAPYNQLSSEHQDYYTHPKYEYEYNVRDSHTGDIKSQHETRDGDDVNGVYSLHEADGSVRTVNYNSHEHSGYMAEVHHSQPSNNVEPASYYHH